MCNLTWQPVFHALPFCSVSLHADNNHISQLHVGPCSTGTDAEFDMLKQTLEKVISEKDQHERAVKQLSEQEATKLRDRQEQADAVAEATLDILNRNAESILPSPEQLDDDNDDVEEITSQLSTVSEGRTPIRGRSSTEAVRSTLQATPTPASRPKQASTTSSSPSPSPSTSASFVNKRAKADQPSTGELLRTLLEDDTVPDVVAAKDQAIGIAKDFVERQDRSHSSHRKDLIDAHEGHRKDLLKVLDSQFQAQQDLRATQANMMTMFATLVDKLAK